MRSYRFEIIWVLLVVLGVFLIFEPWHIRRWVWQWLYTASVYGQGVVETISATAAEALAQIQLSDIMGYLLLLIAIVMVVMRVRWRLMHDPAFTTMRCPKCDGRIHMVHRRVRDRLISLYVPVRRFRCADTQCRWHGLRVGAGRSSSRTSRESSSSQSTGWNAPS